MTQVIKAVMKTEVVFSKDMTHRYLLYKEWDKKKPSATVVMMRPSTANEIEMDYTTMYVVNNLNSLGYGSVNIVNIFSSLGVGTKMMTSNKGNDDIIISSIEKSEVVILAWGRGNDTHKGVQDRVNEFTRLIVKHKNKCKVITDEAGVMGYHPLAGKIRMAWHLTKKEWNVEEELASKVTTKKKATTKANEAEKEGKTK